MYVKNSVIKDLNNFIFSKKMSENGQAPIMKIVRLAEKVILPQRGSTGSAGLDLYSSQRQVAPAWEITRVPLSFAVQTPWGFFLDIRSVVGLAWEHKVFCLPGFIDPDARGMVELLLINFSNTDFIIEEGMKLGQMALVRSVVPQLQVVDSLDWSPRGSGTFGSTGITGIYIL